MSDAKSLCNCQSQISQTSSHSASHGFPKPRYPASHVDDRVTDDEIDLSDENLETESAVATYEETLFGLECSWCVSPARLAVETAGRILGLFRDGENGHLAEVSCSSHQFSHG
jgi:hypothetical protein